MHTRKGPHARSMISAPGRRRCARREQQRTQQQKQRHDQQAARGPRSCSAGGPARSRLLRQAVQSAAAIMLALHLRLTAAFMSTPTAVRLQQTRSAIAAIGPCGWGKGGYGAAPVGRRPSPALVLAMRAATGAASPESEVETEQAGQQNGR